MKQSRLFGKVKKFAPKDEVSLNAQLLVQAGFIYKEMAGVYTILPLGLKVLRKIENIIRNEMNKVGGQELYPTILQNKISWEKTNRWDDKIVNNWFKTKLKNNTELSLAFTHEEPLTDLMTKYISSYKDLPVYLYEICTAFRNEMRAKSGILRGREYYWKALYSFSKDEQEHNKFYEKMKDVYKNIFKQVGIGDKTYLTFASGGSFSKYSDEFQTLCKAGEDIIYLDKEKNIAINKEVYTNEIIKELGLKKENLVEEKAIEVGNIFSLGDKFSKPLNLKYRDKDGQEKFVYMGCYGIGITRLMGVIAEVYNDKKGLIWPQSVTPFDIHIILLESGEKEKIGNKIYEELKNNKIDVLFDDREVSPGNKFNDSDLIGIPYKLIISKRNIEKKVLELENRMTGKKININLDKYKKEINQLIFTNKKII